MNELTSPEGNETVLEIEQTNFVQEKVLNKKGKLPNTEYLLHGIEAEKRKRHQLYTALHYNLSLQSDFDFYSQDAASLLKIAQDLVLYLKLKKKIITGDILFLSFFLQDSSHLSTLKEYFPNSESALLSYEKFILRRKEQKMRKKLNRIRSSFSSSPQNSFSKMIDIFQQEESIPKALELLHFAFSQNSPSYGRVSSFAEKIFHQFEYLFQRVGGCWSIVDKKLDSLLEAMKLVQERRPKLVKLRLSEELEDILETTIIDAVERFKTPVVTTDLLLLIFIENLISETFPRASNADSESKVLNFWLHDFFQSYTDNQLTMVRYKLLKRIHEHETKVREQIHPSQHFFAYLLQTRIPERKIRELLEKNNLEPSVSFFRDELMKQALRSNLPELLLEDVLQNIEDSSERVYS